MTRAKDELNLIVPQRFYTHQQARTGDRHVYAGRTRSFRQALRAFQSCDLAGRAQERASAPATAPPSISGSACAACGAKQADKPGLLLFHLWPRQQVSGTAGLSPEFIKSRQLRRPSAGIEQKIPVRCATSRSSRDSFREFAIMAARGRRALKFCEMQAALA